jgi:hypothetical protein
VQGVDDRIERIEREQREERGEIQGTAFQDAYGTRSMPPGFQG